MSKLTKKEEKFIDEYLIDFNGKRAYLDTFGTKNEDSARVLASRLLTKANIQQAIDKRIEEMQLRYKGIREKIIDRNITILLQDFTNVANVKGNFVMVKDFDELTQEQKMCIKSVVQTRDGVKVEFESKEKAEERIIELLRLNKEDNNENNSNDIISLKDASLEELKTMLEKLNDDK